MDCIVTAITLFQMKTGTDIDKAINVIDYSAGASISYCQDVTLI